MFSYRIFRKHLEQSMTYWTARGYAGSWRRAALLTGLLWDISILATFIVAFLISTYLLSVVGISGLALVVISFGVIVSNPQSRRDYEYFEPPYEEPHFPKWDAQMKREMAESKG